MAGNHEYEIPSRWVGSANNKGNKVNSEVAAMSDIKWQDGAVCFACGKQWFVRDDKDNDLIDWNGCDLASSSNLVNRTDFQINTIKQGDYIEASELDTEHKYNDAVEVFELFGLPRFENCKFEENTSSILVADEDGDFTGQDFTDQYCKRKLTYSQLMAIGKLKRAMIERDSEHQKDTDEKPPYHVEKDGDKYHRTIYGLCGTPVKVDVYRVSDAFPTGSSSIDHAVKKMLCAGLRGHKDKLTDIDNAIESLQAARLLLIQKGQV